MPWADSDPITASLNIRGVWIHDPDDPETTLRFFPYGANQRGDSFDPMQSGTYFIGREDPVFDYGDPSSFSADFTIDVPHGSDYAETMLELRAFARMKKNLFVRDNRSRAVYGTMSNFKTNDQGWGSTVSFTFTRAHRSVETVVI
jgi:hypothetical protein